MKNCKITDTIVSTKKSKLISIGIDVSMENLMICELYDNSKTKIKEIKNSESSIKRLSTNLIKLNYTGKIIMESTGRHHMLLALILSENNLDARVINPLLAKKYSTASIRKVKTDKRDSEILAEIGIKENNLPNTFKMTRLALILRKKMRLISSISKQLQNLNTLTREHQKTINNLGFKLSSTETQIFDTIKTLQRQKKLLEQELENDICECDKNNSRAKNYDTIPGVSPYIAALAALIFNDEYSQSVKQWIAFIGLDVSVKQSAKWSGKGRLTKRGNNYLRMRLYSAAWGATRHNEKFAELYESLKKRNRKHKEALVIIARKIIRIMFSLNKNNSEFDESKISFVTC